MEDNESNAVSQLIVAHSCAPVSVGLVVAIDASRNRSGGAKAHLLGVLNCGHPHAYDIAAVHVWSYDSLLDQLPDVPWLIKHSPPELKQSLLFQLWWQYRVLSREIVTAGCNVLLSTDAGTVCSFSPSVVMSRDMLSFEGNEMRRYLLLSFPRLRLFLLKKMQISSLRRASGVLFLTQYASRVIQRFSGKLTTVRVIPHGIGEQFRQSTSGGVWPKSMPSISCVYVSNVDMYKHQWHVVSAIAALRKKGHPVLLRLVGAAGDGRAKVLLREALDREDPEGDFVEICDAVPHNEIPSHLAKADIFIFASSCENMPNTLVEAMASCIPIACSDRGPMPEILRDAGTYFDPEDSASIAKAIERLIVEDTFRLEVVRKAQALSCQYSWTRCARETWGFLAQVYEHAGLG